VPQSIIRDHTNEPLSVARRPLRLDRVMINPAPVAAPLAGPTAITPRCQSRSHLRVLVGGAIRRTQPPVIMNTTITRSDSEAG